MFPSLFLTTMKYINTISKAFMFTLKKDCEVIKGRRISAAKIGLCLSFR